MKINPENNVAYCKIVGYIKMKRSIKNITMRQLSEKTGLDLSTINRFENLQHYVTLDKLMLICEALELNIDIIPFRDEDDRI